MVSLLFNVDYDAIEPERVVDGGRDKQIDIIRIDEDDAPWHCHNQYCTGKGYIRLQFKYADPNEKRTGLDIPTSKGRIWERLGNPALVNKIGEIRQLRQAYGASNIKVHVYFAALGDTRELSEEYNQERQVLVDQWSSIGFGDFRFEEFGAMELFERLNEGERRERRIDLAISIMHDVNRPSLLQYSAGDTNALICTITGEELARIASTEPTPMRIFDLNVRPFYGTKGGVNKDIWGTCTGDESNRFWFLNNGVTMVCDHMERVLDPDHPVVRIRNAQIVNGCQTSVTMREAWEQKALRPDVRVLLKIYSTDNPTLTERITQTTNNQNRITDRDLHANDEVQRNIQRIMQDMYQFFYERKNKQFRALHGLQRRRSSRTTRPHKPT